MGGAADMGMAVKSLVLAGFFCPNIKTCCINLTAVECIKQSCFVNICAAAGINDNNAVLHLCDICSIDDCAAVNCGSMNADEIGFCKQLVHFNIVDAGLLFDAGNMENIECDNIHAHALSHPAESLSDSAETDDAEGFAVNLNALVCLLFPFAFAHGVTRNADEASAGKHMSHCKLCNSIAGSAGSVHDLDTLFFGIFVVDIVDADAAADDELQFACFACRINDGNANFGCGTNNENIKVLYLFCKLCRLIELFNDFMTLCAQCGNSILFHTV